MPLQCEIIDLENYANPEKNADNRIFGICENNVWHHNVLDQRASIKRVLKRFVATVIRGKRGIRTPGTVTRTTV